MSPLFLRVLSQTCSWPDLDHNFCRDIDDDESGPWCFIEGVPDRNYETCGLQLCPNSTKQKFTNPNPNTRTTRNTDITTLTECYDINTKGTDFNGQTTKTKSNQECQAWNVNTPNKVNFKPQDAATAGNSCRNPDSDINGPWCYLANSAGNATTLQPNWESCGIPVCISPITQTVFGSEVVDPSSTCYTSSDNGASYVGTRARTQTGLNCQYWNLDITNTRSDTIKSKIPAGITHNYCRNYDNESRPWCFTTDSEVEWDYCDIDVCGVAVADIFSESNPDELECGLACNCGEDCYLGTSCNIVNGQQASLGQFPWQVQIRKRSSSTGGFCGGSILNKNFVISAAHCFHNEKAEDLKIAAGFNSQSSQIDSRYRNYGRQEINVKRFIIHPDYYSDLVYHDIALVELESPIVYPITIDTIRQGTNYYKTLVRPVCLPGKNSATTGHAFNDFEATLTGTGVISGFGRTASDQGSSQVLLYGNVDIYLTDITPAECQRKISYMRVNTFPGDTSQCCASSTGVDSCNGDSGGPLISLSSKYGKKYALIGLTSYGLGDCASGMPSVYTRTSNYIEWIKKYTSNIQVIG